MVRTILILCLIAHVLAIGVDLIIYVDFIQLIFECLMAWVALHAYMKFGRGWLYGYIALLGMFFCLGFFWAFSRIGSPISFLCWVCL